MKRIFLSYVTILCLSIGVLHAQYIDYSYLISRTTPSGTARSTGMAGAWGALGADFYSATHNPAGLGYYRSSELVFTPELSHNFTESNYYGHRNEDDAYKLHMNSFGYVLNVDTRLPGLESLVISVGYNKVNNFNQNILINGDNEYGSYSDIALFDIGSGDYYPFTSDLFWQAYIVDYDSVNDEYFLDPGYTPVNQQFQYQREGKQNEWSFAIGMNIGNNLFLGGSVMLSSLKYTEKFTVSEYDYAYTTNSELKGLGFSGILGAIYMPVNSLRLGLAWHTPKYFNLNEEFSSSIARYGSTYQPEFEIAELSYSNITPGKLIASAAVVSKYLLVSADLEYMSYSKMKLLNPSDNIPFTEQNEYIDTAAYDALNTKVGVEFRNGPFRLRGGVGYIGSPFKKISVDNISDFNKIKDTSTLLYTLGAGYKIKSFSLDFAYVIQKYEELYSVYYSPFSGDNASYNKSSTSRFMLTVGFRF